MGARMKTICLDYDGTFTEFPELMNMIIDYCARKDIKCILATMRYEEEKDGGLMDIEKVIDVYYTGRKAKADYLKEKGIEPSIWIDDKPYWLYKDAL